MNTIQKWLLARRWRRALRFYDRAIRQAQNAHKPVAHLIHAKQAFAHECLRRSVAS